MNVFQAMAADAKAAAARLEAWMTAHHPGESEAQAIVTEAKGVVAGLEGAAANAAPLVSDAGALAVDAAKLGVDVAAKSLNLADIVAAGQDGEKAFADLQVAWAAFSKARQAAMAAT